MKNDRAKPRALFVFLLGSSLVISACSAESGDTEEAKTAKLMPVTASSEEARELFEEARQLLDSSRDDEAVALLEQAVAKDPSFAQAYLLMGEADQGFSQKRAAREKALELIDKVTPEERLLLEATEALLKRDREKYLSLHQQLVEMFPEDKRLRFNLGMIYLRRRDFDEAEKEFKQVAAADPDFPPVYNALGYTYYLADNFVDAEPPFQKYIELQPENPNSHHSYGQYLLAANRLEEAQAPLERVVELDPSFFRAYLDLGSSLVWREQHEAAREQYQKLFENVEAPTHRREKFIANAVSYADEGKTDEAVEQLMKAQEFSKSWNDPELDSQDHVLMGRVLHDAKRHDAALEHFHTAFEIIQESDLPEPRKQQAREMNHFFEGRVALKKGNFEAAEASLEKLRQQAPSTGPGSRLVHELEGLIALKKGAYDHAITELEQADKLNAENFYRIGLAHFGKGDLEAAKQAMTRTRHFNLTNSFHFAFVRLKAGEYLAKIAKEEAASSS